MRHGLAAFMMGVALCAASTASAEGMAGNTQFLIGQRYLTEAWKPLDRPSSFGVEVDFAPAKSPVHVAIGLNLAGESKHVTTPFYGKTGKVSAGFLDISAGFLWLPVRRAVARPYVGAGVLKMYAATGSSWGVFGNGDSDQSFGFYGNAGIFFKVGDTFNIGLDGRLVRGTKVTLVGQDGNANYGQASLLLGFSWGK